MNLFFCEERLKSGGSVLADKLFDFSMSHEKTFYLTGNGRIGCENIVFGKMMRRQEGAYQHEFVLIEPGRITLIVRIRIGEPAVISIPPTMCKRQDLGRYRIVELSHSIDANGTYTNTFKGIPASMEYIPMKNIRTPVAYSMLAEVTDNADPENMGRVQVQFAWQKSKNKTTNWIRVRSLDAGSSETVSKNRGFVFVPEIGDQVMVDFELGDPCRPYVSGSMFHRNNGKGGNADNHIKTIVTRSGHTIEFDDSEDSTWGITIKDKEKNTIHWNTKHKTIEILAPLKVVVKSEEIDCIASKCVKLESGDEIRLQAKNMLSINAKNISTNAEDNYSLDAKTIETTAESTSQQTTKGDMVLSSKKEVKTISGNKKIRLS